MLFEDLRKRISPKLKGIVYRLHRQFPAFSTDDLYQEAIFHVWIECHEGRMKEKTDSYILQGCDFYLRNYIRKLRDKMRMVSMDDSGHEDSRGLAETLEAPLDETFFRQETNALLRQRLEETMTPRERDVFVLYLDGMTSREIGERLGISHVRVVRLEQKIREKSEKIKNFL